MNKAAIHGQQPYSLILYGGYFTSHVSPAKIMSRSEEKPFLARTSAICRVTPSSYVCASTSRILAVHHGKLLVQEVGLAVGIMDKDIVHGVPVLSYLNGLEQETVLDDTFVIVLTECHFFAMAQVDGAVGTELTVGDGIVYAVVEYHAVLEYLHHRCAFMACGCHKNFL